MTMSIEAWTSSFNVFISVLTLKQSDLVPSLLKYAETVRDLAAKEENWCFYDESFRGTMQIHSFP